MFLKFSSILNLQFSKFSKFLSTKRRIANNLSVRQRGLNNALALFEKFLSRDQCTCIDGIRWIHGYYFIVLENMKKTPFLYFSFIRVKL